MTEGFCSFAYFNTLLKVILSLEGSKLIDFLAYMDKFISCVLNVILYHFLVYIKHELTKPVNLANKIGIDLFH